LRDFYSDKTVNNQFFYTLASDKGKGVETSLGNLKIKK